MAIEIFKNFDPAMAFFHAHTTYATVFASLNRGIPSVTSLMDTLGEVPCIYADDGEIKKNVRDNGKVIELPSAIVPRPDVADIFLSYVIPQIKDILLPRREEVKSHGLSFTLSRHGLFTFARNLDEAVENFIRVENSAHIAIHRASVLTCERIMRENVN